MWSLSLLYQELSHLNHIENIKSAVLTEVTGFPVCKLSVWYCKQPLLQDHKVSHIELTVAVYITFYKSVICINRHFFVDILIHCLSPELSHCFVTVRIGVNAVIAESPCIIPEEFIEVRAVDQFIAVFAVQPVDHSVVMTRIRADIGICCIGNFRQDGNFSGVKNSIYHILCILIIALSIVGVAPRIVSSVCDAHIFCWTCAKPLVNVLLSVTARYTADTAVFLHWEKAAVKLIYE